MYSGKMDISIVYAARYRGLNVQSVHTHSDIFQLYILNNDRLELFDGKNAYTPDSESSVILIKPSEKHCLRLVYHADTQDWFDNDINCAFDCKFSVADRELYKSLMALPQIANVEDISFCRRLADIILKTLGSGNKSVAYSAFNTLIYFLLGNASSDDQEEPIFYTNNTNFHADISGIKDIKNYIDINYTKKIELDELIRISHMNRSTLCREFRRVYATSPIHYILQKRVDEAKIYLAESSVKVSELSEQLGFSSASYFNRVFRQFVGQSPSRYRNENQSLSVKP